MCVRSNEQKIITGALCRLAEKEVFKDFTNCKEVYLFFFVK